MTFSLARAERRKAPALVSLWGVSGSGKTYSALLLAAGLAGPGGTVGLLDAENGRGAMYADSPAITAALPGGYQYAEIREPFAPARFAEAAGVFEDAGVGVLVIDSFSHEWEGAGGCQDIAEAAGKNGQPNWVKGKLAHKRLMNRLLASPMHLVFCLRAREKVEVQTNAKGAKEFVSAGLQPIAEKNFVYEMTLSLAIAEGTHQAHATKCPEALRPVFGGYRGPLCVADGEALRRWAESGLAPRDDAAALLSSAEAHAAAGTAAYKDYWASLPGASRSALLPHHERLKALAAAAPTPDTTDGE